MAPVMVRDEEPDIARFCGFVNETAGASNWNEGYARVPWVVPIVTAMWGALTVVDSLERQRIRVMEDHDVDWHAVDPSRIVALGSYSSAKLVPMSVKLVPPDEGALDMEEKERAGASKVKSVPLEPTTLATVRWMAVPAAVL